MSRRYSLQTTGEKPSKSHWNSRHPSPERRASWTSREKSTAILTGYPAQTELSAAPMGFKPLFQSVVSQKFITKEAWKGEWASARFVLEFVNLANSHSAWSSPLVGVHPSVQTYRTPVLPSGYAKMACFEAMEPFAKGCRVNGGLMHGLEAHATGLGSSKTAMRQVATNHFRPSEPNSPTYPTSNDRVMGFQPMSCARNSSPTTASLLFAKTSESSHPFASQGKAGSSWKDRLARNGPHARSSFRGQGR